MSLALVLALVAALPPIQPGYYNAEAQHFVGFRQLEIHPGGEIVFRAVVTHHLPPAEIETHLTQMTRKSDGSFCLAKPAPGLKPCLKQGGKDELVGQLPDGRKVVFKLARKGGNPKAPPIPLNRPPSDKPLSTSP